MALIKTNNFATSWVDPHVNYNFNLDWLSFSGALEADHPFHDKKLIGIISAVVPDLSVFVEGRGRYSFLNSVSTEGVIILYNQALSADCYAASSFHVIFSGMGLKLARSVLGDSYEDWLLMVDNSYRIGRVDLALDVFNSTRFPQIKHQLLEKNYVSSWRRYEAIMSSDDGFTFSFGRRGSDSFLRIYDKLAQTKALAKTSPLTQPPLDGIRSWFRVELELRSFRLSEYTSRVRFQTGNLRAFFHRFLNQRLTIMGFPKPLPPCEAVLDRPQLDSFIDPIYRKIDWVRRQVLPTLLDLNSTFGPDWLYYIIGDLSHEDWRPTLAKTLMHWSPDILTAHLRDVPVEVWIDELL